jgi:hypothetical protein
VHQSDGQDESANLLVKSGGTVSTSEAKNSSECEGEQSVSVRDKRKETEQGTQVFGKERKLDDIQDSEVKEIRKQIQV